MEDDQQDACEASPHTHRDELARIGDDRRLEENRHSDASQLFAQGHVLQDRLVRESPKSFEESSSHEQSLVSIDNPRMSASEIVEVGDQLQTPIMPREAVQKPSGLNRFIRFHGIESG